MLDTGGLASATYGQFDIEQQIRRTKLVEYVSGFGGMSEDDARLWLDKNCPAWRSGIEPPAKKIEVEMDGDDYNGD